MTHSLKSSYKEPSEQLRNGNRILHISRISLGNWLLTKKYPLSSHAQFFLFFCEDIVITHAADLKLNSSLDFFLLRARPLGSKIYLVRLSSSHLMIL